MIWNLIGTIGGKVLDIVDDVVEDKDEANKLKFQIQRQLIETKNSELEAQAKIVLAEAREAGSSATGVRCSWSYSLVWWSPIGSALPLQTSPRASKTPF